ncbi:MAG: glycosyltransferase family 2 protein [Gammaproteobacteria bacterium]|jgi:teichuronic acid biosynthesis glycosyltransferase TuaG
MPAPLVSVITPCLNASAYIGDCLDSVLAQSLDDWEHIIVDDGSTDDSFAIAADRASGDKRIRLYRHENNRGVGAARNHALRSARGRYIAFLDADDLWLSEKLSVQIGMMRENNWAFSFTNYGIIDARGNDIKDHVNIPSCMRYRDMLRNTAIGCLTVVIDSSQVMNISMPEESIARQDYVLWCRIMKSGFDAHGIDRVLAKYRVLDSSRSRNKLDAARRMWIFYRRYEYLNPVLSSWYFLNYVVNAFRKYY